MNRPQFYSHSVFRLQLLVKDDKRIEKINQSNNALYTIFRDDAFLIQSIRKGSKLTKGYKFAGTCIIVKLSPLS